MVNEARAQAIAVGIAVGLVSTVGFLTLSAGKSEAKTLTAVQSGSFEMMKVQSMLVRDPAGARKQALSLYRSDRLRGASDYVMAARVFCSSTAREDVLLAHDLALAGLVMGDTSARLIVAQTEDRLFKEMGLGERFGTLGGKELPLTKTHRNMLIRGDNLIVPAEPAPPVPAIG